MERKVSNLMENWTHYNFFHFLMKEGWRIRIWEDEKHAKKGRCGNITDEFYSHRIFSLYTP